MTVAARSSSECAASDRIASEPVASPTAPLASVSPPEAAIEVSATRSLSFCISWPPARPVAMAPAAVNAPSAALVSRHILGHGNANELQSGRTRAPLFGGADDGLDGPALPVFPSPADAARADLHRDDHDRCGDPRRPRAASGIRPV